jgi:adenine-specific DNA-methyltransferase
MEKLDSKTDGASKNIVKENIEKLKQIFPDVFSEDNVDFDKLKEVIGDYAEDSEERYNFTWYGKSQARRIAQTPSTGTLRPCKEDSKDWDTTGNLFIEGDNLEVLKLLQKSYHKKVKMIYIDPPYNTGKEFIYPDNYKENLDTYLKYTGQKDSDGCKFSTNTETTGRYHTNWLNMMYPRLKLARNLLRDDGVIFISIDDNEVSNLRKLCDEIFGEENFVSIIMWKRKKEISNDSKNVAIQGEYIIVYSKSVLFTMSFEELSKEYIDNSYSEPSKQFPDGKWRPVPITVSKGLSGGGYDYEITTPSGKKHKRLWAYPESSYNSLVESNHIYFGLNEDAIPQRVIYAHESKGKPVSNYWDDVATNKEGKKMIIEIFGDSYFDTPKPIELISKMIGLSCCNCDTILDFFSGSCTTAHSVLDINIEDKGSRKFIMVQLPEPCDEESDAYKADYKTIAEIGKERIRRSGDKILKENKDKKAIYDLDVGFKVFKLDSSNIKSWDGDFDNLDNALFDAVHNVKEDRTEDDVLYEILLKYGLDLTLPIEERKIADKTIYSIGLGALVICLDSEITIDIVDGIVKLKEELNPEVMRVVFKDNGFKDDVIKTNAIQALKQHSIEDVKSL